MCSTEVLIPIPALLWNNNAVAPLGAEHVLNDIGEHCILIDSCIVPAVKALWDAGIVTLSSCCGHAAPEEDHPWGVLTIQTKPGVAQRGAVVVRRERYEDLVNAANATDRTADLEEEVERLRHELTIADDALEGFWRDRNDAPALLDRAERAATAIKVALSSSAVPEGDA